jgi:hypothetical protein
LARDTRGWWELALEIRGFLQQQKFSAFMMVATINPGMGCVWAMVVSSWLQQADTATISENGSGGKDGYS